MINLLCDLDGQRAEPGALRRELERAGVQIEVRHGAPERTLAWIDDVFGGWWSSEVAAATNVLATRDGKPVGFASVDARVRYPWLRGIAREADVGLFGPFGVAPEERGGGTGPALLALALDDLRRRGKRRALVAATNDGLAPYYWRHAGALEVERFDPSAFTPVPLRTVVLASGAGSNFQAVIDAVAAGLPLDLRALVSNRATSFALERARAASIPAIAVPWKRDERSRAEYDAQLQAHIEELQPEVVLLLGWMHLLAPSFVDAFPQMLNVHPAFLPLDPSQDAVVMPDGARIPAFRGAHAVADALAAEASWVGASVHAVTADTDRGRIYARRPLRVEPGEDEAAVLARLHPLEHTTLITAIRRLLFEQTP